MFVVFMYDSRNPMGADQRLESLQIRALQLSYTDWYIYRAAEIGKYKLGMCVIEYKQPDFLIAPDLWKATASTQSCYPRYSAEKGF